MNAFRLETFAPLGDPCTGDEAQRRIDRIRDEAYRAGFVAGQSAATESFLEDQARLTAELVETICDAALTNEAARLGVAASLAPMVAAVCHAVAPALAEAGLGAEIVRLVERALQTAPAARPRLRCAPELAAAMRELLAGRGIAAIVEEAPELLPREAQVFWDQGYDALDLEACAARVLACVAAHLQRLTEGSDQDARRYG